MPVPIGLYRIVEAGVCLTAEMNSSTPPDILELPLKTTVEISETHAVSIDDRYDNNRSRVRGRVIGGLIPNEDNANKEVLRGWITLFEVKHNKMRMYAHPKKQQPRHRQKNDT